jgi:hypothetical protein
MLSFFKSKRNKWRDEAKKHFQIYIDSLKGMDADELGSILDVAKTLKESMLQKIDPKDTYTPLVFAEPSSCQRNSLSRISTHYTSKLSRWRGQRGK